MNIRHRRNSIGGIRKHHSIKRVKKHNSMRHHSMHGGKIDVGAEFLHSIDKYNCKNGSKNCSNFIKFQKFMKANGYFANREFVSQVWKEVKRDYPELSHKKKKERAPRKPRAPKVKIVKEKSEIQKNAIKNVNKSMRLLKHDVDILNSLVTKKAASKKAISKKKLYQKKKTK